jgi:hypothetical protein
MYSEGDFCEILPVARGNDALKALHRSVRWSPEKVLDKIKYLLREPDNDTSRHSFIHAIWIRWEDGVAYRQDLCHIWGETWNLVKKREVNIQLG